MHSPLGTVFVAQLADLPVVCVLPDAALVLPRQVLGTTGHAEQAVLEAGTLGAVPRTLDVRSRDDEDGEEE